MGSDSIVIYPFILPLGLKASLSDASPSGVLDAYLNSKPSDAATATTTFLKTFQRARNQAIGTLANIRSDVLAKDKSVNEYLSLCSSLCRNLSLDTTEGSPWLTSQELRRLAVCVWTDKFAGSSVHSVRDICFDVANILLSDATWNMCKSYQVAAASQNGLKVEAAPEAYKHLCVAAGQIRFTLQKVIPMIKEPVGADLSTNYLEALRHLCLADAQSIMVLRSIASGRPAKAITTVSLDTATLYSITLRHLIAAHALSPNPPPPQSGATWDASDADLSKLSGIWKKVASYLKYKNACFASVALAYGAVENVSRGKAGAGVRMVQESQLYSSRMRAFAEEYDAAEPRSNPKLHAAFDTAITRQVNVHIDQILKEGGRVPPGDVPAKLPDMLLPQRLVEEELCIMPPPADDLLNEAAARDLVNWISTHFKPSTPGNATPPLSLRSTSPVPTFLSCEPVDPSQIELTDRKKISSPFATASNNANAAINETPGGASVSSSTARPKPAAAKPAPTPVTQPKLVERDIKDIQEDSSSPGASQPRQSTNPPGCCVVM